MSLSTHIGDVHDLVVSVRHDVVCITDRHHRVEPMLTPAEVETLVALLREGAAVAKKNGKLR